MSFINQMSNLRASIEETKKKTKQAVADVKKDTEKLRKEAQNLVHQFTQEQKAKAKNLHEELKKATQRLEGEVSQIRGNNLREQRERRREFAQARDAFWGRGKVERKPDREKKEKPRTT